MNMTTQNIKVIPVDDYNEFGSGQRKVRMRRARSGTILTKSKFRENNNNSRLNPINKSNKLFEIFTFILCFVLFLWQMGLSMHRYWLYPVSTLITINSSKTTFLPSITICNNNYRFQDMLRKLAGVYNTDVRLPCDDLETFWIKFGIEKEKISTFVPCDFYMQFRTNLTKCEDYHSFGELTTDVPVQTTLGQCIDMTLNYPAHQRIFGIAIKVEDNKNIKQFYPNEYFKEYYNIYAHDRKIFYKNDIFINTRAPKFIELWIAMEKKEYLRLNSPKNPCQKVQDSIKCLDNCVEKRLANELKCRLPFMRDGLPLCDSWAKVLHVYEFMHRLHATGEIYNCSCIRPCEAVEYKVNRIESMKFNATFSQFSIELENRFDEIIEESYVYPISSLINDFSALVGFFLGVSLPGLIDVAELGGRRTLVLCKNCRKE